jgi:DegT/DnrJ/EryC1/StrS aminotransferase family
MRSLGNQGRDSDGTWLRHVRLGYNYRLDELSAAVGVAQLERLKELRSGRRRVAAAYERALRGVDWVRMPRAGAEETVDWHVYVVRLHEEIDRDGLTGRLAQVGGTGAALLRAAPPPAVLPREDRVSTGGLPRYRAGRRGIDRVSSPIPKGVVSTWWSAAGRSHTLTRWGPLGLLPAYSATPTEWLV